MAYKFEDLGRALNKMAQKLTQDQQLCRLLKYMNDDPLSNELEDWDQTISLVNDNIKIIPKVSPNEKTECFVIITISELELNDNIDFTQAIISIDVLCPINKWLIKSDICPRPYKIMDRIYEQLQGSRVTGIGTLQFLGAQQSLVYEDISDHHMTFEVTANG